MTTINVKLLNKHIRMCCLSKRELARRTGVHPSTITNITRGHHYPTFQVLRLVYHTLDLTYKAFFEIFFPNNLVMSLDEEEENL